MPWLPLPLVLQKSMQLHAGAWTSFLDRYCTQGWTWNDALWNMRSSIYLYSV